MLTFLILAPYGAFTFLMLVTSAAISLFASAAVCLVVIARRHWLRPLGQNPQRRLGHHLRGDRPLRHARSIPP